MINRTTTLFSQSQHLCMELILFSFTKHFCYFSIDLVAVSFIFLFCFVFSSASDLKQQWEVNPSPTPSLQVESFHPLWLLWPLKYRRSTTSPCRTVPSPTLWLPKAQTTPGCFPLRRPSTAPSLSPALPSSGKPPPTSPLLSSRIGRDRSRGVEAKRAREGRRGGRGCWPAPPPPAPWPSARGPSWRGWRGERGRGAGTIFFKGKMDEEKMRRCCQPGEPLRRAKSWSVNFFGSVNEKLILDTNLLFFALSKHWSEMPMYSWLLLWCHSSENVFRYLFLLSRQLFWKSGRVTPGSGNLLSSITIPWQHLSIHILSLLRGLLDNNHILDF